jgi:hypothetical protein
MIQNNLEPRFAVQHSTWPGFMRYRADKTNWNKRTMTAKLQAATLHHLPTAGAASDGLKRNPGQPLDLGWLEAMRHVNKSALERRVQTLTKRRSIKATTRQHGCSDPYR